MANAEEYPIRVSAKIIADISSGIYRTPANALKELVSNAFDADATKVIITTDYPYHKVFTCSDNGKGMIKDDLKKIMLRIGGSDKRAEGREHTDSGRPLIGKIGIGILAVAQICRKFTVISTTEGNPFRFEAIVDLKPFFDIDVYKRDLIEIGKYIMHEDIPEKPDTHYTRIILEEIDEGFRKRLLESENKEIDITGFKWQMGDPETFEEFIDWVKDKKIRELSEYNRMIWELAVITPVRYLENGPIKNQEVIPNIKKRLNDFDFNVIIDGIELKKPLIFPTDEEIKEDPSDFHVYKKIYFDDNVNGKRLKFYGYIYHQRKSIYPPELRGILPRIRNVAIGSYDKSLFNYPKSEGPIMQGISGEIYIEDGLEDALNIDRNSFRESDSAYIRLQEYLFAKIGGEDGFTLDIRKRSKKRMIEIRKSDKEIIDLLTMLTISKNLNEKFTINRSSEKRDIPIHIDKEKKVINIFDSNILPRRKNERMVFENILTFFEIAKSFSKDKNELSEKFYKLLRGMEW